MEEHVEGLDLDFILGSIGPTIAMSLAIELEKDIMQ